jgi:hypothetical protein
LRLVEQEFERVILVASLPPPRRNKTGQAAGFGLGNVRSNERRILRIISAARRIVAALRNIMRRHVLAAPVNPLSVAVGPPIPGVIKYQDFVRHAGVLTVVPGRNEIQQVRLRRTGKSLSGRHAREKQQQQKVEGFHKIMRLTPRHAG